MKNTLDHSLIKKATRHLKYSDKKISALIEKYGACSIRLALDNPFHALTSSIISQQLSASAARAIKGRLFAALDSESFTPEGVLKISPLSFKTAGLSRAKQDYIRGIALVAQNGDLDFPSISECHDDEVISRLIALQGVGRWTAEMFLIFGLGRPDVLSVSDAGLKKGFKLVYGLEQLPSAAEMIAIGERWKPYRSVASWYLWRTID